MSLFSMFRRQQSAPMARERLQVLLAHERAYLGADLVTVLREEILAVIARHVEIDGDKIQVTIDHTDNVSILEIEVELPENGAKLAA